MELVVVYQGRTRARSSGKDTCSIPLKEILLHLFSMAKGESHAMLYLQLNINHKFDLLLRNWTRFL